MLTKIYKTIPAGRPIVSCSGGPKERISSFVDSLLPSQSHKTRVLHRGHYFIFGRLNAGYLNKKLIQINQSINQSIQIHRQTLRTDSRHYNGHQNGGCFLGHFHGSRWETTTTCEPLQPFLRLEEIYWWHLLSVDSSWDRNQQLYWFRELFPHNNKIYTDKLSSQQHFKRFLLEPKFLHFNNNIKGVIHG